jgi:hypothetical protein
MKAQVLPNPSSHILPGKSPPFLPAKYPPFSRFFKQLPMLSPVVIRVLPNTLVASSESMMLKVRIFVTLNETESA